MKTTSTLLFVLLMLTQLANAQQCSVTDLNAYDFLNHRYQYINQDYNIDIEPQVFVSICKKYNVMVTQIDETKDSIAIIMLEEFETQDSARFAALQIAYSWQRLGYHLWKTAEEAEAFGKRLGATHLYEAKLRY